MQTLYRKYRPSDFEEIFGQNSIVNVLKKQVEEERVGHAYLFAGPRGTGKTSVARLLAKAVNCTHRKDGNPCKKCSFCLAIQKGRFLDLVEIDAASNRGIDEIRRLRERVGFSPSEGEYKVYIIDEVHMLTKDAFNALLKTLEEPPEHVIFVLATTEPHKVLPTIQSRCQRFNFGLAPDDVIFKRLRHICRKEKVKFTKEALMAIVKNSQGSFRDAESILEKVLGGIGVIKDEQVDFEDVREILGLAEEEEVASFVDKLLKKDMSSGLKIFDNIVANGVNLFQFIREVLEYLRKLLLQKVTQKKGEFRLINLLEIITELSRAEGQLRLASIERLPIEVAIVKICSGDKEEVPVPSEGKSSKKNISGIVSNAITTIPRKIRKSLNNKRNTKDKGTKVDFEKILKNWDKIVEGIAPFNHHLSAFFRKAKPIEIKDGELLLHVPYKFHKERIESEKARRIFAQTTKEVLGEPLSCDCKVTESESMEEEVLSGNDNVVLEILGDI